ncbi:MAG: hypothetical protein H6679_05815 [Epsilonproteobacteria bacterium]|nr:hypothetical protein [Campylobacterota bacterium]
MDDYGQSNGQPQDGCSQSWPSIEQYKHQKKVERDERELARLKQMFKDIVPARATVSIMPGYCDEVRSVETEQTTHSWVGNAQEREHHAKLKDLCEQLKQGQIANYDSFVKATETLFYHALLQKDNALEQDVVRAIITFLKSNPRYMRDLATRVFSHVFAYDDADLLKTFLDEFAEYIASYKQLYDVAKSNREDIVTTVYQLNQNGFSLNGPFSDVVCSSYVFQARQKGKVRLYNFLKDQWYMLTPLHTALQAMPEKYEDGFFKIDTSNDKNAWQKVTLIFSGTSFKACDHNGDTLLHIAVQKKWYETAKTLICNCPELMAARNHQGKMPIDYERDQEKKRQLQEWGQKFARTHWRVGGN